MAWAADSGGTGDTMPETGSGSGRSRLVANAARVGVLVVAAAMGVAAWREPGLHTADGALTGGAALPFACVVAFAIAGCLMVTCRATWPAWVGVLIVGQAAALQLVEAGPVVRYQHYAPLDRLVAKPWLLAVLLAQALLVGAVVARDLTQIRAAGRRLGGPWALLVVAAAFVVPSATLSRPPARMALDLAIATLVQMLGAATVLVAALSIPSATLQGWRDAIGRAFARRRGWPVDPAVALCAVGVTVVAAMLAWWSYERQPHIPDEIAYLFQARYFAEGRLWMTAPPVGPAFDLDLMSQDGDRWYSLFPPGWPAVLAIGVRLGSPWLVNPVLGGLNLLLLWSVLRRLYDDRLARIGVGLLAASPWYVFLAMSYMSHTFSLTCLLVALLGLVRARHGDRLWWALVGGLAAGTISLIRPLEGATLCAVLGLWALWPIDRRLAWRVAIVFAAGGTLTTLAQLPYNAALSGEALRFPLMAYFDRLYGPGANALGFGPDRGFGWPALDPLPGHGPLDVLVNGNFNTFSINTELFGWASGSLAVLAWWLASRRVTGADWLMLAIGGSIVGIHSLYWFSGGPDFGARYWYPVILPAIVLTARGVSWLGTALAPGDRVGALRAGAAVVLLSLSALVSFFPWRAMDKYFRYRGIRADVRTLTATEAFGRSLVLVRGTRHRDFAAAAIYNPLDLHADAPVFAWDRSAEVRAALLRAYPDRTVWMLDGGTLTGGAFKVVAGPLPPGSALPAREGEWSASR